MITWLNSLQGCSNTALLWSVPVAKLHRRLMDTGTRRRLLLLPGAQWLQARTPAVTFKIMQCLMVSNNMLK